MPNREFTCSRCQSKLVASNEDVIGGAEYVSGIVLDIFHEKSSVGWKRFLRFDDLDQKVRKADGYRYTVKCLVCGESAFLYDHLTNIRIEDYYYYGLERGASESCTTYLIRS